MRTIETTVYKYSELNDEAKRRARDWYRNASADDSFWSEFVLDDAETIGGLLGIDFRRRGTKANIWFSGFCSQGDGACFEGTWRYNPGVVDKVRDYAPKDEELHAIARDLARAARRTFYTASARCDHRGHYYHSGCMAVDVDAERGPDVSDEVTDALRAFADWIYSQLEREYDYTRSDEAVAETIEANEYEFTEDGEAA